MNLRNRIASTALLTGLFGSVLVGSASMALATGGYSCTGGGSTLYCSANISGHPITITLTTTRALNNTEISVLQDNLSNSNINSTITAIKNLIINTIDPCIIIDLVVCVDLVCE